MMNAGLVHATIEIELSDGTVAVWFLDDAAADGAADLLTEKLGQPDSIKC